jgi:AraC family transcriptional regulator
VNAVAEATYKERIQRAIDYTEANLTRQVTLAGAADAACWSPFHFMRTFHAITGYTFAEYVRNRRMELAAYRLIFTRDRILEIAMEVGYEAQEAFTRAFKRCYGSTPGRFRAAAAYRMRTPQINVEQVMPARSSVPGGSAVKPTIKELGTLRIMGAELRTNNDGTNLKEIPQFWERCMAEKILDKIPSKIDPNVNYGVCTNMDENSGDFSYVIGSEVSADATPPEGLGVFGIPAATYAVFVAHGPFKDGEFTRRIQETWKYAYGEWFPGNSEWERADGPDFELYDEQRCSDTEADCDIYIPVQAKE